MVRKDIRLINRLCLNLVLYLFNQSTKSNQMAELIMSEGTVVPNADVSTLKKMQKLVQGYIEFVYLADGKILVVNEDGRGNPFFRLNVKASEIAGQDIVGDAILMEKHEIN